MFYTPELLYFRRNGKFARCWLAAILSEEMFKQTVRQPLKTIDISVLCDQILAMIQTRCGAVHARSSLYLSSQLMYGTVKLFSYKTKQFEDNLFTIYRELYNTRGSRQAQFDMMLTFREVECPRIDVLYNPKAARDMHLIADYLTILEQVEEPNFGAITDYETEMFLLPQTEDQFLNEIRRFLTDQPQEISEESAVIPVPSVDESAIHIEDVQIGEPPAPRRRSATSHPDEPPTKKQKISSEEVRIANQSAFVDSANEVPSSSVLQVPSVTVVVPVPTVLPRERFFKRFDKNTELSAEMMKTRIGNVRTCTIYRGPHDKHTHPAKHLLSQPCLAISLGQAFGRNLAKLFSKHLITRPVTENEFPDVDFDPSLPDLQPDETVREDLQSKIQERTVDISNKMTAVEVGEQSKTALTAELSKAAEHIPVGVPPEVRGNLEESTGIQGDKSLADLPEITGFEEIIEESRNQLSPTSKRFSPEAALTKKELGALLDVLWDQAKRTRGIATPITFHEMIPPDNYTKIDAARAFDACLGFHAEKRLVLKQAKPYDTIYIEKYPTYSSESSEQQNSD